jgi:hypothetical protein
MSEIDYERVRDERRQKQGKAPARRNAKHLSTAEANDIANAKVRQDAAASRARAEWSPHSVFNR